MRSSFGRLGSGTASHSQAGGEPSFFLLVVVEATGGNHPPPQEHEQCSSFTPGLSREPTEGKRANYPLVDFLSISYFQIFADSGQILKKVFVEIALSPKALRDP